jgi:hypothetical protein
MGFNKLRVPELETLKLSKNKMGTHKFGKYWHRRLIKADALIGDSESFDMIKQFAEKAYNANKKAT